MPPSAINAGPATLVPGVKKIAVLRPNAVGDFVFALPCLHALKAAYPDAHIIYIGLPWHAEFLAGRPGPVGKVVVMPPCPGIGLPPDADIDPVPADRFVRAMQEAAFDIAVQIYGGGRYANPFVRSWNARLTIGMKSADAASLDRWLHYGSLQNRRLQMLDVAALVGADTLRIGNELQVTERDRQEAGAALPHRPERRLVLLQPGSSDPRRCWPAEKFADVADRLARHGAVVAINGTRQEASIVRAVIERMRYPAIDLSGRLSLSGLCGVLERAALVVSNDTGPLHLALAIGTPAVGIYWLTNLVEFGPLNQQRHRPVFSTRVHCPVCGAENLKTRCAHDASFLGDVSVDDVSAAAMALFDTGK